MLKRRDFLRGFIGAGVFLGIDPISVLAGREKRGIEKVGAFREKAWMKTIFCQFDNWELRTEIEECAKKMDCDIFSGEPSSPDLIAIPYFISIVDRSLVGDEFWNEFLRYCKETNDNTPCLIVDNNKDLPVPKIKNKIVSHFDLQERSAIEEIIEIIMCARLKVLSDVRNQS